MSCMRIGLKRLYLPVCSFRSVFDLPWKHTVKCNTTSWVAFTGGLDSLLTNIQYLVLKSKRFHWSSKKKKKKAMEWMFFFSVWHVGILFIYSISLGSKIWTFFSVSSTEFQIQLLKQQNTPPPHALHLIQPKEKKKDTTKGKTWLPLTRNSMEIRLGFFFGGGWGGFKEISQIYNILWWIKFARSGFI